MLSFPQTVPYLDSVYVHAACGIQTICSCTLYRHPPPIIEIGQEDDQLLTTAPAWQPDDLRYQVLRTHQGICLSTHPMIAC